MAYLNPRQLPMCTLAVLGLMLLLSGEAVLPVAAARSLRQYASVRSSRLYANMLDNTYLNNDQLGAWMTEYVRRCPGIARRMSIGKTVQNRTLWVLEISDRPGQVEAEPNFKYIANMHGDETGGRALLPLLAEWLCDNYQKNNTAARIVRDMHLFIMPSMNPDGFEARYNGAQRPQRGNANNFDLNRNFPDPQRLCSPDLDTCDISVLQRTYPNTQREVAAVINWSLPADLRRRRATAANSSSRIPPVAPRQYHFTASANLHEGAVVANYPWDGAPITRSATSDNNVSEQAAQAAAQRPSDMSDVVIGSWAVADQDAAVITTESGSSKSSNNETAQAAAARRNYHAAPDDATFIWLAQTYANHAFMATDNPSGFEGGITNGAAWYTVYGGMQDWNYLAASCMELTLELNMEKYPAANQLGKLWTENKEALIALPIAGALAGIQGKVTDAATGAPLPATVRLQGINWRTYAEQYYGFYTRPVRPGRYTLIAVYPGYQTASIAVTVPGGWKGVVQNIKLTRL